MICYVMLYYVMICYVRSYYDMVYNVKSRKNDNEIQIQLIAYEIF